MIASVTGLNRYKMSAFSPDGKTQYDFGTVATMAEIDAQIQQCKDEQRVVGSYVIYEAKEVRMAV